MEMLKQWALSATIAVLAGAMLSILLPGGRTQKTVKTVIGIFILTSLILPFSNVTELKTSLLFVGDNSVAANSADFENALSEQMVNAVKESVESTVFPILNELGIEGGQISADVDIDDSGSIVIKEIKIIIAEEYAAKKSLIIEKIKEITEIGALVQIA